MNDVLSSLAPVAYAWLALLVVAIVFLVMLIATAVTGWPGGDR